MFQVDTPPRPSKSGVLYQARLSLSAESQLALFVIGISRNAFVRFSSTEIVFPKQLSPWP